MVHRHKPECLVKRLDEYVQDQDHSEGSQPIECLSVTYISCTTAVFVFNVTRLDVLMYYKL